MSARDDRQGERPVLDELTASMAQTAILQSSTQELDASLDRVGAGIDALVGENARLREVNAALLAALRGLLHHNAGEITCECCQEEHRCVFCLARAALAQADGREP